MGADTSPPSRLRRLLTRPLDVGNRRLDESRVAGEGESGVEVITFTVGYVPTFMLDKIIAQAGWKNGTNVSILFRFLRARST